MFRIVTSSMVLFALLWGIGLGQIPQTLSYQGVLKEAGGNIVPNGTYNLTFRIYSTDTGGSALWTEAQAVPVVDGLFNVILGSSVILNLPFDVPYWLGVTIGTGSELTPRIQLTSAAYSLNSNSVADNAVTTAKIVDGAVTQVKLAPGISLPPGGAAGGDLTGTYPNPTIATNAVTTTKINDGAITQEKLAPGLSLPPGGTAGGDLTGTYPNPTIATNAVTTAKINDGAVTQAKLATGVTLPPGGTAGGDLSGTYPNPTVDGIQGRGIAATAPGSGQVLKWNGSNWAPGDDNAGSSVWTTSGNDIYNSNSGNVGIGFTSPLQKLHVNGSLLLEKTGPAVDRLILRTTTPGDPGRYGIQFSNNTIAPFVGDDLGDMYYGFSSVWGATRLYDAHIRVYGKSTATWGNYLDLYHNGTNGIISTDAGNITLAATGDVVTTNKIFHSYGGSLNGLGAYGTTTYALYYINNSSAGDGWGLSAGMSSSSASAASYGLYGFNYGSGFAIFGSNSGTSGIGIRGINQVSGNYGDLGTQNYGVIGVNGSGNYGYIGSSNYSLYGYLNSTAEGSYAIYGYGPHSPGVNGTGFGIYHTLGGVQGYCYYGNPYTFGVAGYSYLDYDFSGGCFGSRYNGGVWGSMAYRASGGLQYGGYFTSLFVVPGDRSTTIGTATNVGLGAWGDLFGADIHGRIYGLYTEGNNYASFSNGATFKNNLDVHLQDTKAYNMAVLFTNVSTDVTVQTSGFSQLNKGEALIEFDDNFKKVVSSEIPIVVTVTPMGECQGVYVASVDRNGFRIIENNRGESSVPVSFIAIGRRAGYEQPQLPSEVIASDYVEKLSRGFHNDADTQTSGEGLYYQNGQLVVGRHPSTLPQAKPAQDPDLVQVPVQERPRAEVPRGDGAAPSTVQSKPQQ